MHTVGVLVTFKKTIYLDSLRVNLILYESPDDVNLNYHGESSALE